MKSFQVIRGISVCYLAQWWITIFTRACLLKSSWSVSARCILPLVPNICLYLLYNKSINYFCIEYFAIFSLADMLKDNSMCNRYNILQWMCQYIYNIYLNLFPALHVSSNGKHLRRMLWTQYEHIRVANIHNICVGRDSVCH